MSDTPLIHVVDDDSSMRDALLLLLSEVGLEVRGYASAGEFRMSPLTDRPGCLLLDMRMPGPSGLDLQAALKRQNVLLPIVFLTGHGTVASSVTAMKAGAVDFLTKPVTRDNLLDAVQRALARDAAGRAARGEAERTDPLWLQFKEARRSVMERYLPKSAYRNQGQPVVEGQRSMQAASDIFFGWAEGHGEKRRHFYVRQLRDMKLKPLVETFNP